jgi:hypothetical protein
MNEPLLFRWIPLRLLPMRFKVLKQTCRRFQFI